MNLRHLALLALGAAVGRAAEPAPVLPLLVPLFGDHAVLQRDRPVALWGWAAPGSPVTLAISGPGLPASGTGATATAGADGAWRTTLGPLPAGGPHVLQVDAGAAHARSTDVLVGDVWLCSGQSNMEFAVNGAKDAAAEKAAAAFPRIRHLAMGRLIAGEPGKLNMGRWAVCAPETVGSFTAVGYFFARTLHQDLGIPIGLVNSSYGGTRAECWISAEALSAIPESAPAVARFQELVARDRAERAATGKDYDARVREWYRSNDPGSAGEPAPWADPATATGEGWSEASLPAKLKAATAVPADFTGTIWLRRDVDVPAAAAGRPAMLNLVRVKDMNAAWVNGRSIGDSESVNWLRKQRVPAGVLTAGRNTIAIRLVCLEGECGITGDPRELALTPEGHAPLPLAGPWRIRLGAAFAGAPPMPARFDRVAAPTSLFNGMIAPLLPLTTTGTLWYQGESSTDAAWLYRSLLPALIRDWRARAGQGDTPFLIVQLPNHMGRSPRPENSAWAELREAQALTARNVPGCGLAVTIDIGEADNVHPLDKQDVGKRLALVAEAQVYHRAVASSGPRFRAQTVDGRELRLAFDEAAGLAAADGKPLTGFAIAGSDRKFAWATARIDGDAVVLSAPEVPAPVAARYAWASNPACNLTNASGLPAAPFRTDEWPGITRPK